MNAQERDLALLGLLGPDDRSKIEDVVDEVIEESLPTADPVHLEAAAHAFEDRAMALPDEEKIVAWQIAAALRLRARKQHRLN
jgi:hypothetical protein